MNNVSLVGRLVRDPEIRYAASQMAVCTFTIAVDRQKRSENGPAADFIRITTFGKTGENCSRYLNKGRQVAVTGMIRTGSYEKDGQRFYTTDVVANNVTFLAAPKNSQQNSQQRTPVPDPQQSDDLPPGFESIDEDDIPF